MFYFQGLCQNFSHSIFMHPRSKIWGHIVFCPVCHSVLLSETLTLLITCARALIFHMIFLVIGPFRGYHYFWPCDLDLGVCKNFNVANHFWTVSARALIFHMSIPCDETFPWVRLFFYLVTLTREFDLLFKNFIVLKTFEEWVLERWYFTRISLVIRSSCRYLFFWPWHLNNLKHTFHFIHCAAQIKLALRGRGLIWWINVDFDMTKQ